MSKHAKNLPGVLWQWVLSGSRFTKWRCGLNTWEAVSFQSTGLISNIRALCVPRPSQSPSGPWGVGQEAKACWGPYSTLWEQRHSASAARSFCATPWGAWSEAAMPAHLPWNERNFHAGYSFHLTVRSRSAWRACTISVTASNPCVSLGWLTGPSCILLSRNPTCSTAHSWLPPSVCIQGGRAYVCLESSTDYRAFSSQFNSSK